MVVGGGGGRRPRSWGSGSRPSCVRRDIGQHLDVLRVFLATGLPDIRGEERMATGDERERCMDIIMGPWGSSRWRRRSPICYQPDGTVSHEFSKVGQGNCPLKVVLDGYQGPRECGNGKSRLWPACDQSSGFRCSAGTLYRLYRWAKERSGCGVCWFVECVVGAVQSRGMTL